MANVGEQLLQPETGWRRIDDTNINIRYSSNMISEQNSSCHNNTNHYSRTDGAYYEFYIYSSNFRLIAGRYMNKNYKIEIDGVEYPAPDITFEQNYYCLAYEKLNMGKTIHHIKFTKISGTSFELDAIDIDEDGYMVYCDDNGKLYYDVTPIMTSDNTPAPYVASASSSYDSSYSPYKAFDGTGEQIWVNAKNTITGWLKLDFGKETKINAFTIIGRHDISSPNIKDFKLYGSDNDSVYSEIDSYTNINDWSLGEKKLFQLNNIQNFKYYKIEISKNNGYASYSSVGEIRFLLAVDTPFYLIQDNSTNKVYNYNEENNQLIEVSDTSILNVDALNNTCIYDLTKVKDLIDLTDDNITILSNQNVKLNVEGIKNNKELIISNQNLSTINAEVIHNFILETNKVANGNIKFVISNDNGVTWQTWNGTNWTSLTNTCSLKKYSQLSDSEKIQWDKLKEEIWLSGISTDTTGIDYNIILTNKTIRFAFVLYRPSYDDNVTLKYTQWLFDRVGAWHKLSEDDIDIAINSNMCTVTPKLQSLTNIKVNILL